MIAGLALTCGLLATLMLAFLADYTRQIRNELRNIHVQMTVANVVAQQQYECHTRMFAALVVLTKPNP